MSALVSFDELLAAYDADLGQPQPLRRGHHARGDRVPRSLVGTQVHFRLGLLRMNVMILGSAQPSP